MEVVGEELGKAWAGLGYLYLKDPAGKAHYHGFVYGCGAQTTNGVCGKARKACLIYLWRSISSTKYMCVHSFEPGCCVALSDPNRSDFEIRNR